MAVHKGRKAAQNVGSRRVEVDADAGAILRLVNADPAAVETLWAYATMRAHNVDSVRMLTASQAAQQWVEHTLDPSTAVTHIAAIVTERSIVSAPTDEGDEVTVSYIEAPEPEGVDVEPSLLLSEGCIRLAWAEDQPNAACQLLAAEMFQQLLNVVLEGSDGTVDQLQPVTAEDLALVAGWNDTDYVHDAARPLISLFDEALDRTPDASAVEVEGVATSYADLHAMSERLAQRLVGHRIGPGDAVALCADRSLVMTAAMLAILRSGAAYVPVDPAYPDERQHYMISDSGARVVLADRVNADRLRSSTAADIIELSDESLGDQSFSEAGDVTEKPMPLAAGSDPGYVIYTSGSTGLPKGVVMPQRALSNLVEWQLRRPQAQPHPRTLQFSALSFDVSFQEIYSTWASGGTLVLISESARRDADSLLDSLIDGRVDRLFLPFVALRALAQTAVRTGRYPTTLSEVYTAGEQLQVDETVRTFFASLPGCVLENQYGPSETHVCSAHTLGDDPTTWPTLPPIGAPIANSGLHVFDKWGAPRPIGMPGELYVSGRCLADGYQGKADMTNERFVEAVVDGRTARCYRTGDVVRWLDTGDLEFLGRADGQVKLRGFRVEPGEVTTVLSAAPGVKQSVAVVRDDVGGSAARMVGYIVPDDPERFDLAAVQQHASAKMPEYMVPTHWAILSDMPLTPSGKLDQRALPMPTFDRDTLDSAYVAPQGAQQETLASIWGELLGVDSVGVNDNFFDLGGDSLLAVEMMTLIHERLGLDLPLGALARTRTIAELDAVAGGDLGSVWGSLVPLRESGERTPLFVVHGGTGNVATFPVLAEQLPDNQPVYALQWDGLDGSRGTRTIHAMADRYLQEIRSVQPSGPYQLAGQCIGGLIAREMAVRLESAGESADFVMMYDSPNLASPAYSSRKVPFPIFQLKRVLTSGSELKQRVGVHLRMWLRRPIPAGDREIYGSLAMISAAWKYRPDLDRPRAKVIFIGSGLSNASHLGLAGHWDDGAMGWRHHEGERFEIDVIEAEHNDVPYHPDSVIKLASELNS